MALGGGGPRSGKHDLKYSHLFRRYPSFETQQTNSDYVSELNRLVSADLKDFAGNTGHFAVVASAFLWLYCQ